MFEIKLTDGHGKEIDPDHFAEELMKGVLKSAEESVKNNAVQMVCPEHGKPPEFKCGEFSLNESEDKALQYSFCCENQKNGFLASLR